MFTRSMDGEMTAVVLYSKSNEWGSNLVTVIAFIGYM